MQRLACLRSHLQVYICLNAIPCMYVYVCIYIYIYDPYKVRGCAQLSTCVFMK